MIFRRAPGLLFCAFLESFAKETKINVKFSIKFVIAVLFFGLVAEGQLRAGGVVSACDQAGLESALSGGGSVTFACDGTITLSNTITISEDSLLDGSGHAVTLSGNNVMRILYVNPGVRLTLVQLTIANGFQASTNSNCGGGIFNGGGIFTATNCTFIGNQAGQASINTNSFGGALYSSNGTVTLVQCGFYTNSVIGGDGTYPNDSKGKTGVGGAIYSDSGSLAITACSFVGNLAMGGFGPSSWPFSGTGGPAYGGAIFSDGAFFMTNSTLAANAAISGYGGSDAEGYGGTGTAGGGALYNSGGNAILVQTTITDNKSVSRTQNSFYYPAPEYSLGGGVEVAGGSLTLLNSILSSNLNYFAYRSGFFLFTTPPNGNCYGSITDGGHNISSDSSRPFSATGSRTNTDPMLRTLFNYGGSTPTLPPREGSPAIDAGDDLAAPTIILDQRGYARRSGPQVDVGAVEYQYPILPLHIDFVSRLTIGAMQLGFTNSADPTFTVLAATNINSPITNWSILGLASQTAPGQFQFTDAGATNISPRFYRVRNP